jgi:hypothetical protein
VQPLYDICHLSPKFDSAKSPKMKKITLLFFCLTSLLAGRAQQPAHTENDGHNHGSTTPQAAVTESADLLFREMEYDFSKIPQGKPVYHFFEVVNQGKTAMKLDNVQASCGCTTPEWSRDPIAPGASTKIKIGFNAASEGIFEKYITIYYNNSTQNKQIKIKGFVWKAPEGPAPANASVDLLKKQTF